ncbi:hypothetical protein K437DRAFT_258557 [Tilletiaria anomala UBC 951]|uniref:DNA-directed RNA polymerase III subunit RPC9 n=1 Tax=Tilletiaria anomala (strain ATCC 24038 / CBS 436.72 / UBC 951) TaxID=1037660 RepID=A0A066VG26_TILAU|nr:uncharacterized protein K437DRAFT_258557 [Tilletiaria anomala UBC 951]KDN40692.1 hypothetical protein K437DRAFT_258557 [Tilletiaria anomala UBC 951]
MRVVSKCSALLSDFEVLSLLKEMEQEQLSSRKAGNQMAHTIDKKKERAGKASLSLKEEEDLMRSMPENIRTIQYELINTLSERHRGCAQQTPEIISNFLDELKAAGFTAPPGPRGRRRGMLTKAEQLQILNHSPQTPVELYTMVDGMEERLEEQDIETLLGIILRCLPPPASPYEEMLVSDAAAQDAQQRAATAAELAALDDEDEAMNAAAQYDQSIVADGDEFIHEGKTDAIDDEKDDDAD